MDRIDKEEIKAEKAALKREREDQRKLSAMLKSDAKRREAQDKLAVASSELAARQAQKELRQVKAEVRSQTLPGRAVTALTPKNLDRTATKVVGTGIRATGAASADLTRGVGAGVGLAFKDIFRTPSGGNMARGRGVAVSTKPIALRSSGMELLGRDNKVYKLSPVAPPKGVRGAADYDALEATFGPTGGFTRDQALKVLVNVHSGQGQSLYAISGRFVFMLRQGYIQEVPGVIIPQQTATDKQGILTVGSEYGILE